MNLINISFNQQNVIDHVFVFCCFVVLSVDLSSWEQKIQRDAVSERLDGERTDEGAESVLVEHQSDSALEMSGPSQELYKDGVLTLGCIGNHFLREQQSFARISEHFLLIIAKQVLVKKLGKYMLVFSPDIAFLVRN